MDEIVIRKYEPGDHAACMEVFKGNVPQFFTEGEIAEFEEWLAGQDEKNLAYRNTEAEYYFVAAQDEKIIACGGFYISRETKEARMTWGMVDRSLHKKGIGRKLLLHRLDMIRALHPECSTSLDTTQHSFSFFEKLGFVTTKVTPDFYAAGMHRYDMVRK